MNNSPDQDVALFAEALRLQATERAGYLARACAGNEDLRQRVEALLSAFDKPTADYDAKWGRFVIDGGTFTRLVYAGV